MQQRFECRVKQSDSPQSQMPVPPHTQGRTHMAVHNKGMPLPAPDPAPRSCDRRRWKSLARGCPAGAGARLREHAAAADAGTACKAPGLPADHAPVHAASFDEADNLKPFSLYVSSRHTMQQVALPPDILRSVFAC